MNPRIERFLNKHDAQPEQIMYICRAEQKTVLHLISGKEIFTYITVKDLLAALPADQFICIDKGVVVSRSQVADIRGYTYYMTDGTALEGRKNRLTPHKEMLLGIRQGSETVSFPSAELIREKFAVLDSLPLPFAVIVPCMDVAKPQMNFTLRYANAEAERIAGRKREAILGKTVLETFPLVDPSAVRLCAEVVMSGEARTYIGYTTKMRYTYTLRIFRPMEGCCAVLLYFDR